MAKVICLADDLECVTASLKAASIRNEAQNKVQSLLRWRYHDSMCLDWLQWIMHVSDSAIVRSNENDERVCAES